MFSYVHSLCNSKLPPQSENYKLMLDTSCFHNVSLDPWENE